MNAEQATPYGQEEDAEHLLPPVHHLTREEAEALFDENARYYLGISGEEFKRRWDGGEYADPDQYPVMNVAFLLPLLEL